MLRETKRRGGPLTSPRAAFISTPPLPAARTPFPKIKVAFRVSLFPDGQRLHVTRCLASPGAARLVRWSI